MASENTKDPDPHNESSALREAFLRAVRLYTYNTPISKGKYRLFQTALDLVGPKPTAISAKARDGRKFLADLSTGMEETVFFLGEYERFITSVAAKLIQPGDTCIDVGANFGWYTTLMAMRTGEDGKVHSFEPVPRTFQQLTRNVALLDCAAQVTINNLALGDRDDVLKINVFGDLTTGHASLAEYAGHSSAAFDCKMTTLDSYLAINGVEDAAFVKVDIEGAELMFLRGAESLFYGGSPPVFLMEMALEQTGRFGYLPNDLIKFIAERDKYLFYKIDELNERLIKIDHFETDDIGANVFCIPEEKAIQFQGTIEVYE